MDFPQCTTNCTVPTVGVVPHLFSTLISSLMVAQCSIAPKDMWPKDVGEEFKTNCKQILYFISSRASQNL